MSNLLARRAVLFASAAVLSAGVANSQTLADQTGLSALRARLGASAPTGAGVRIGLVEAAGPGFAPDPAHPELAGKSFVPLSPAPSSSWHATMVALYGFGVNFGMAPGALDLELFEAAHWLASGFLQGTSVAPPAEVLAKIINNSWGSSGVGAANQQMRKLDYAIDERGLFVASGVNNGAGPLDSPLVSHSFNGLAVGRSDGQHRAGPTLTGFDRPGRMKPELVAPAPATSFATPLVSGAAALLVETARTWPGLAGDPDAERPEVLKAVLMAGAEHRTGWSNGAPQSGDERGATRTPLDPLWGADELDIDHAHWILSGGAQPSSATAQEALAAPHAGWERVTTYAGSSRYWRFDVERSKPVVSVVATWNRQSAVGFAAFTRPEYDLELWELSADGQLRELVGERGRLAFRSGNVRSASEVDNVEHLYLEGLAPGAYVLELRRKPDFLPRAHVAVAWELRCGDPLAFGVGTLHSAGRRTNLGWTGFASQEHNDFELRVWDGPAHARGVLLSSFVATREPLGRGVNWIAAPLERSAPIQLDEFGAAALQVPIDEQLVGQTRYYQFWFRDPLRSGADALGLSNALAVGFCR